MTLLAHERWLLGSVVAVLIALAYGLGGYPLLDPDEGRNAEIAREMAVSNNYVIPRLNELPYLDKPVLYFAVGALSIKAFGATEFAARLPSLLFTFGTLCVVWIAGQRMFGRQGALIAVAATGSTPLTLAFARTVIFDSALAFFVVLSIIAFYLAAEEPTPTPGDDPGGRVPWWTVLGWAALGLGVLTKGPIAVALPAMVLLPYLAWRRRLRVLWDLVGVLLFVAILLPWIVAMSRVAPDFLRYVVVTETVLRLTTDELQRTGPIWYFLPIVIAGSLPWSALALFGWRHQANARNPSVRWDHRLVLLALWIIVPLVFFSLSQSKRPQYVVPLMPAFGLLAAYALMQVHARARSIRLAGGALIATGAVILFARIIVAGLLDVSSPVLAAVPGTAIALGAVCVVSGGVAWAASSRVNVAVLALCVPVCSIPLVSGRLMEAIGDDRSASRLASTIRTAVGDEAEVVAVRAYPLSLPFYLQRTFVLSTADASELTSNYLTRTYSQWARGTSLRPADWWFDALTECTRPRVFIVSSDDARVRAALDVRVPLIMETRKFAAYGPCGVSDLATRRRVGHAPASAG